eukprot:IDg16753t1
MGRGDLYFLSRRQQWQTAWQCYSTYSSSKMLSSCTVQSPAIYSVSCLRNAQLHCLMLMRGRRAFILCASMRHPIMCNALPHKPHCHTIPLHRIIMKRSSAPPQTINASRCCFTKRHPALRHLSTDSHQNCLENCIRSTTHYHTNPTPPIIPAAPYFLHEHTSGISFLFTTPSLP